MMKKLLKNYGLAILMIASFLFTNRSYSQLHIIGSGLYCTDASVNGEIVVGYNDAQHFMWTETDGLTLIGGVGPNGYGGKTAINGEGTTIAATRVNPNNNLGELSSYDIATQTWTSHGSLGSSSGNSASSAWGMSSDGSSIVGLGWVNAGSAHAIKWTATDGVVDLGSTVPNMSSRANATNHDGSIVGGWQDDATGFRQGAFWIDGEQTLISHGNGDPATEVGCMSDNGIWAGGGQGYSSNFQAWLWSEATGLIDIGPAPVSGWRGAITGLSGNGEVAVGFYRPWPAPATFGRGQYYTEATGLIDLTDYGTSLGFDMQGQILALPLAISDDGSTVVGITDSGQGFVLKLPFVPLNNECENAIEISCGDVKTGSTENATDTGGEVASDVYYTFTGTGTIEDVTVSLCDGSTNYDSYLRVFSDCTLANEIASNNDSCGEQSELSFESDGTSTYYIMVEGAGDAVGNYSLEVTCEPVLSIEDKDIMGLQMFPNPTNRILNIAAQEVIDTVEIRNVLGQQIYNLNVDAQEVSIDMSAFNSGTYFVTFNAKGTSVTKKLIKN